MRALPPSGVRIRLSDIWASFRAIRQGDEAIELFRQDVCRHFGVQHAFFVSSGRAALSVLLSGLRKQYPEKNEVALPAYTSFSVPSAVVNAGFKISLYDLDQATLSPNLQSLRDSINDNTLCIVVCHLFGYPCAIDEIKKIATEKAIPIIDDAAQAMGATYQGAYVGTLGTAGLFSLSRGKNITAVDGGIIVTNDDRLATALRKINLPNPTAKDSIAVCLKAFVLSFLLHPRIYWFPQKMPFLQIGVSVFNPRFAIQRLLPFQAGIGRNMLCRLAEINATRQRVAGGLQDGIKNDGCFVRPLAGAEPVYLRLPVFRTNGALGEEAELGVVKSYPLPLDAIAALRPHLVASSPVHPVAQRLADTLVTLPTHEFVTDLDIKAIREHVRSGCRIQ